MESDFQNLLFWFWSTTVSVTKLMVKILVLVAKKISHNSKLKWQRFVFTLQNASEMLLERCEEIKIHMLDVQM